MTCMDVMKKNCEEILFKSPTNPAIFIQTEDLRFLCASWLTTHTDVLLSTCTSDIKYSCSVYLVSSIISFQNNAAQ